MGEQMTSTEAAPGDLAALATELDEAIEDVSDGKGADAEKALDRIATCLRAHRCAPGVEVVSGEDVHTVSRNSWVIRCHEDGTPWLNVHPMPASAAGKHATWWRVLYRAPAPSAPLAVGDTVTTAEELDALTLRSVVRRTGVPFGEIAERWSSGSGYDAGWYSGPPWRVDARRYDPSELLPARVLDIPEIGGQP